MMSFDLVSKFKYKKLAADSIIAIAVLVVLVLTIKGNYGSPTVTDLIKPEWTIFGPLELSPDRGRYALMYSLAEDKSVFFSNEIAAFAMPDLGYYNGHFVSLFAPLLSIIVIPGYLLGKLIGISQVGAFSIITLFSFVNFILIRQICRKMGCGFGVSNISALTYLFATNSFAYTGSLYQHQITSFILLLCLYSILYFRPVISVAVVSLLFGFGFALDYPNAIFLLPLPVFAIFKSVSIVAGKSSYQLGLNLKRLLPGVIVLIPLFLFGLFNNYSYGSPFKLSGTVSQVKNLDFKLLDNSPSLTIDNLLDQSEKTDDDRNAVNFFDTRDMLQGFYVLIFSPDRGLVNYSGIVLYGLFGFIILYRKNDTFTNLFFAVISLNFLLYSMWGDPWGGWAFGPRYLIPSFAVLSILSGIALQKFRNNLIYIVIYAIVFVNFTYINTIGALTSNANPPQPEVLALEELSGMEQKYKIDRNIQSLDRDISKSFVFGSIKHNGISAWEYFRVVYGIILSISFIAYLPLIHGVIRYFWRWK